MVLKYIQWDTDIRLKYFHQQEIKDLWHIWSIWNLSIYLSALLKSASNVRTFEADVLCTFEADFFFLSDWLRQITWENKLNLYGILYIWGRILKCTVLWLAQRQNSVHLRPIFNENDQFL